MGWISTPCMLSITGFGLGFQLGIERDSFALVLNDKSLIHALKQGREYDFGGNVEVTVGPTKLEDEYQISEREHTHSGQTFVYAKRNGMFLAAALNATVVSARKHANHALYGELTTEEILCGDRTDVPSLLAELVNHVEKAANP